MFSLEGVVVSIKCKDSAVVLISKDYLHPLYGKRVKSTGKVMAHDSIGVKVGDKVRLISSKPISKSKRHIIKEVL